MVRSGGKRVPPALEALVMKCMEKDPDQRYQSAAELHEGLAHCLPGTEKVEPARASSSGRWIMVGLAVTVVILAVAVVLLMKLN